MGKYKISMKQAIFIGQAPAFHGQKEPLIGKSSKRLEKLCGLSKKQLNIYFDKTNIFKHFPGKMRHSKGDQFDMQKARILAKQMDLDKYRLVVFLGLNVAKAFEIKRPRLFKEVYLSKEDHLQHLSRGVILPHPSGVSHFWNTLDNRNKASKTLRRIMKKMCIGTYSKYFHVNVNKKTSKKDSICQKTNLRDNVNKSKYF